MAVEDKMLADLTDPQRQAVTHVNGPLLVLAGAGSGKTRVITRRIGYLLEQGIDASVVVAITFTNKAADEMARRVRELLPGVNGRGPTVSTFHSFCVLLLRMYGKNIGLEPNFTIFDTGDSAKVVRNACGDTGALPNGLTPAKMQEIISRTKTLMIRPEEMSARLNLPVYQAPAAIRIFKRYEEMLKENKALDFDDLLLRALDLLDEPTAKEAIHHRYQYLLIDEYQDTNHVQYLLAQKLAEHTRNICATGDPDQSIYGWRGAELSNILNFEKDYPDAAVVYLENNYRSTGHILAAANSLICNNKARKEKRLLPVLGQGVKLKIHSCEDETDEAKTVVGLIGESQKRGLPLREIAVMCRVNSIFRVVEQTLRNRGVPYQLARGVSFFQRREIRDLMAYLRVLVNPDDQIALERIINTPTRGIGAQAQNALKESAHQKGVSLYQAILHTGEIDGLGKSQTSVLRFGELMERFRLKLQQSRSIESVVRDVIDQSTLRSFYHNLGEKESRTDEFSPEANLDEFISVAQKYDEESSDGTMTDFLAQQSLVSDTDAIDSKTDSVTLLTMHAAKGLEFGQVIIVAAEEEIIPHVFSCGSSSQIEEERRLFFVAMTRAKQYLNICHAHHRATRGSYRPSAPSRFLKEIDPQTVDGLDVTMLTRSARPTQFVISPRRAPVAEAPVESAHRPRCQYRPGQRVYHEKFGHGVIQDIYLSGSNYLGTVQFHSAGIKKLVLNIAPLQVVKLDAE